MIGETLTYKQLANYIVGKCKPMPHAKLQKLLFYIDSYHLAYFGKPLLDCQFEAWVYGPVVKDLFYLLKPLRGYYTNIEKGDISSGHCPIISEILTSDQINLINNILDDLDEWTLEELERAVLSEEPWIEARQGYGQFDNCSVLINKETTMKYYKRELRIRRL